MMADFPTILLSARAQKAMDTELERFPNTETGGLLLGYSDSQGNAQILEATDSGYANTIHEAHCFQYDDAYEWHLCTVLSQLYDPPLDVIGIWHKHNAPSTIPFSHADDLMHQQLTEDDVFARFSILYEKTSGDSDACVYRQRVFLLSHDGVHRDVSSYIVKGE